MKILRFTCALLLLALASASAQIKVEVTLTQNQFLANETLTAAVRVSNLSGKTITLGAEADWLKLSVESREGGIVSKLGEVPVVGEFKLDSSQAGTKRVDLAPYFSLVRPGRYTVRATVRVPGWEQEFTSTPAAFDIIQGAKLWEQEFGVPATNAATLEPEMRKYVLQQANYLKQLQLYVRVTDSGGDKTFNVRSIGRVVSMSQPETQVDAASRLHILWQNGARAFAYRVVNPAGEVLVQQTYDYTATRPKLRLDDSGKIIVAGGARRVTRDDLPAPAPEKPVAKP
jgi:hypothetical protein